MAPPAETLSGRINQLLRQQGPQTVAQLAAQLQMAASALEPLLQLLEQRGQVRSRMADLRSRSSQPQRFYQLGLGERLTVQWLDAEGAGQAQKPD
jgi:predicted ArsR family transcriptional regulator